MTPFVRCRGIAAPLDSRNVDTDQIIPARFLKKDRAKGYGQYLFHDARFDESGTERPDFVLNREPFRGAPILLAGDNFGCGSSREGAVYALADYGIRAVLAPSFGDIFYNNCMKNGVVPVRIEPSFAEGLGTALAEGPDREVCVDLEALAVTGPDGRSTGFELDPFWRECLLKGVDEIELTLGYLPEIEAFERRYAAETPWATRNAG